MVQHIGRSALVLHLHSDRVVAAQRGVLAVDGVDLDVVEAHGGGVVQTGLEVASDQEQLGLLLLFFQQEQGRVDPPVAGGQSALDGCVLETVFHHDHLAPVVVDEQAAGELAHHVVETTLTHFQVDCHTLVLQDVLALEQHALAVQGLDYLGHEEL